MDKLSKSTTSVGAITCKYDDEEERNGNCLLPKIENNLTSCTYNENMDILQSLKTQLMSGKDQLAEQFVLGFVNGQLEFEKNITAGVKGVTTSSDDAHQNMVTNAIAKLTEISPILAHRFMPILKEYIGHVQQHELNLQFAHVTSENVEQSNNSSSSNHKSLPNENNMSERYKNCFNAFIDAKECVSIKALDTKLLGKLDAKDVYILTLWAMATCKRQKGDNLLQLVCSGKSSSGNLKFINNECKRSCVFKTQHLICN